MQAHRVKLTIERDGTLTLRDIPFQAGETVEVIILAQPSPPERRYPLRGTPVRYDRPTEPVAEEHWEVSR
ncbi:MAG TPA: hypothetical protein VFL91_19335 [Thermomicrobiales bacterium]|nr:hypothetical protein [Thermomicrobiales bacterium]